MNELTHIDCDDLWDEATFADNEGISGLKRAEAFLDERKRKGLVMLSSVDEVDDYVASLTVCQVNTRRLITVKKEMLLRAEVDVSPFRDCEEGEERAKAQCATDMRKLKTLIRRTETMIARLANERAKLAEQQQHRKFWQRRRWFIVWDGKLATAPRTALCRNVK